MGGMYMAAVLLSCPCREGCVPLALIAPARPFLAPLYLAAAPGWGLGVGVWGLEFGAEVFLFFFVRPFLEKRDRELAPLCERKEVQNRCKLCVPSQHPGRGSA